MYPSLSLDKVHGTITYHLANRVESDEYFRGQDSAWAALGTEQDRNPPSVVRRRLRELRKGRREVAR